MRAWSENVKTRKRLHPSVYFNWCLDVGFGFYSSLRTSYCRHITAEQVIHHAEINPVTDVTIYDDICDNRDLNIYLSWDPKDQ